VTPAAVGSAFVAVGYLLGSIPFGFLLARGVAGVDVRRTGSGNIGATNVSRAAGRKLGVLTLLLDAAKGGIPVWAAAATLGAPGAPWAAATGFAAFLGHVFPVWLRFRGGKGVATAFGVFLALSPAAALVALLAFAGTYGASHIVSVSSLAGAAAGTVAVALLRGGESPVTRTALAILVLVVIRHRTNIERLLRGEERRVGRG
jgi:glycerol-3-phosphate acyltransferase PlsY